MSRECYAWDQAEREARQARLAVRAEREARKEARRNARRAEIDGRIAADLRRMERARRGEPMSQDEVNKAFGAVGVMVTAVCVGLAMIAMLRLAESFMPPT